MEIATLLVPHGPYRIDPGRSERRDGASEEDNCRQNGHYSQKVLWVICPNLEQHTAHEPHHYERHQDTRTSAQCRPPRSLAEKESQDLSALRAKRHAHANLMPALRNGVSENSVHSDCGQQQCGAREQRQRERGKLGLRNGR